MKYDNPDLQMKLAAEYVLGTLHGPARTRFERLLASDPALRARVAAWEQRLAPWHSAVRPVPAPEAVWQGVQRRLGHAPQVVAKTPKPALWWRWWAVGSTAFAAWLLVLLLRPTAPQVPAPAMTDVAVLATDSKEPAWIVRVDAGHQTLSLSSLNHAPLPAGKSLELWSIPGHGAPLSLGVLPLQQGQAVLALSATQQQRLAQATVLAISLEPQGGSPTGLPTGPVLYTGKPLAI